jgi:hypothetical protein
MPPIQIRWPSGSIQTIPILGLDRFLTIVEGEEALR